MRKFKSVLFVLFCIAISITYSYAKDISYTLDDRDRLIRVEEGLKGVNQRIDSIEKRIDGLDKRIDGLQGLMYVVIGAIIAQTLAVVGFSLWDRRSALMPVTRKTKELEEYIESTLKETKEIKEREIVLENAIREYAKHEPKLYEVLKSLRLL
ncbi:MAG: hypothetical protein QHH74_13105 [Spirochaetota bacterium]|nr:hypothetical protein [Spirochaetota bacterium]